MKLLRTLALLAMLAAPSAFAVTVSGTGTATILTNDPSPDLAFTMPATGSNRAVVCGFGAYDAAGLTITNVTYGGQAMTQAVTLGTMNTSGLIRLYTLVNPPTGANNFTLTFSVDNIDEIVMACGGFVDVDQTTPVTAASTPTATGTTNTSTNLVGTLDASEMLIGLYYGFDGAGHTITPSDTQISESQPAGGVSGINLQYSTDGTLNWTLTNTPDHQSVAFVLNNVAGGTPALDQEGFRWGIDDNNEASHTFEAAEDTNVSLADTQSRLLRVLVEGENTDPANAAYTLRSQKNGSGGYVAVPVGATTAGAGISNQTVAASADDATETTGDVVTLTDTTIGTELDSAGEWIGFRFTNIAIPAGATITAATVGVVPSANTQDEPDVVVYFEAADDCAAFTTGTADISNRARTTGTSWASTDLGADGATYFSTPSLVSDLQAVINRGGWASGNDVCVLIGATGSSATRDLTVEAYDLGPGTNPPRISISWTTANEVYIATSGNITAGGEATTARLTAPSSKTTGDFVTGRRWDDENGTDSLDITTDNYTEVEWLVALGSAPVATDYFDFRVYAGSGALDTYTFTPRWTVPSAGGSAVSVISAVNF